MSGVKTYKDTNASVSNGGRMSDFWDEKKYKPFLFVGSEAQTDDSQTLIETYKWRGFEFGNWMSGNNRQDDMACAQPSFADLARIIGSKNLGLDHHIGVAFGARGRGGSASAHYEPHLNMINITKTVGAGALAHEYGHALDYNFGQFVDQDKDAVALSYAHSPVAYQTAHNKVAIGELRWLVNYIIDYAYSEMPYLFIYSAYWSERTEIFARMFEEYVAYKLAKSGQFNYYLTKRYQGTFERKTRRDETKFISKTKTGNKVVLNEKGYTENSPVYLNKEQFEKIVPYFDKLVKLFGEYMNGTKKTVKLVKNTHPIIKPVKTKGDFVKKCFADCPNIATFDRNSKNFGKKHSDVVIFWDEKNGYHIGSMFITVFKESQIKTWAKRWPNKVFYVAAPKDADKK